MQSNITWPLEMPSSNVLLIKQPRSRKSTGHRNDPQHLEIAGKVQTLHNCSSCCCISVWSSNPNCIRQKIRVIARVWTLVRSRLFKNLEPRNRFKWPTLQDRQNISKIKQYYNLMQRWLPPLFSFCFWSIMLNSLVLVFILMTFKKKKKELIWSFHSTSSYPSIPLQSIPGDKPAGLNMSQFCSLRQ